MANGRQECTLSDEELIERGQEWVSKLARSGGKAWSLRVPVDFNHDPDMIFCEIIKRMKEYKGVAELDMNDIDVRVEPISVTTYQCIAVEEHQP